MQEAKEKLLKFTSRQSRKEIHMTSSDNPQSIMESTPMQQEPPSHTQPHGSINPDGKLITQSCKPSLAEVLERLQASFVPKLTQPKQLTMQPKPSLPSAKPQERKLKDDPKAQDQLTLLLSQTYASQATYGDKALMMEYRDQMFQMVLAEYTAEQIKWAFVEHVRRSSTLPTPHDIARLIDPSLSPLCASMYNRIRDKIKNNLFVSMAEESYMRQFEANELKKVM